MGMSTTTNEYDCGICMTMKTYPIHLICCKQFICKDCIIPIIKGNRVCPMCRGHLPSSIYPLIDTSPPTRTNPRTSRLYKCRTCMGEFPDKDSLYQHIRSSHR